MRTVLAAAALLVAAPFVAACGPDAGSGSDLATDPGTAGGATATMPTEVPAAPGVVNTRGLVTVRDEGGAQLCLGPVAESWPPQCGGPRVVGWKWSRFRGIHEVQEGIRWGQFAVTGTWDGTRLTFGDAVPAALYDAMAPEEPPAYPSPAVEHSEDELGAIAEEVGDLPGAQGAYTDGGHVLVDVTYDDGSLQGWADETYGRGVVIIRPMLVDAQP